MKIFLQKLLSRYNFNGSFSVFTETSPNNQEIFYNLDRDSIL